MSDLTYLRFAVCRDVDAELFFPPQSADGSIVPALLEPARRVCAVCPVREECLDASLARGDTDGVFGGLSPAERRALRARQRVA